MFVKFITPVILLTTAVHAQTVSPVVGHIEKWSCPLAHYQLNDKPGMGFYTEVRQGNKISLDPTQVTLEFQEESGALVKVTYKELPFSIKSKASLVNNPSPSCPLDSYCVKRNQKCFALAKLKTLQAGDRIEWAAKQPALTIRGTSLIAIKYTELPYTVSLTQTVPTLTGNLWDWFTSWFTTQQEQQRVETATLGTRGVTFDSSQATAPYIKLLETPTQQVIAGRRGLTFAWKQGQPPFTLTIEGHGKRLIRERQIWVQQLRQAVSLTPGEYRIYLQDSKNEKPEYTLKVVPANELPSYPAELLNLSDKPLQAVLKATWLAGQEGEKWKFEAYQQVVDLLKTHKNYSPAQILREALLKGEVPVAEGGK